MKTSKIKSKNNYAPAPSQITKVETMTYFKIKS